MEEEELQEIEDMARATIQGDGDFNWFLIEGEGKSEGGVWRDQCGNMPIAYDADDVYFLEKEENRLPEDPPFPKNWRQDKAADDAYIAAVTKRQEDYCKSHPDITFIGHLHPGRALRLIQTIRSLRKALAEKSGVVP